MHSHAFSYLMQKIKIIETNVNPLDFQIKEKVDVKIWKEKKKKLKALFKENFKTLRENLENKVREIDKRFSD